MGIVKCLADKLLTQFEPIRRPPIHRPCLSRGNDRLTPLFSALTFPMRSGCDAREREPRLPDVLSSTARDSSPHSQLRCATTWL